MFKNLTNKIRKGFLDQNKTIFIHIYVDMYKITS